PVAKEQPSQKTEKDTSPKESYAERKERQRAKSKLEKAVSQSEAKIEGMENRLKELDEILSQPENASDMNLVTEYTSTKRCLDEEVERWGQLSEELEGLEG
ncbi:MAG: ABC transporter ATP-binding protein, partial [Prevotella sp.]|nr:ABC transporter ATP-binding protein [Prevotella sp.]